MPARSAPVDDHATPTASIAPSPKQVRPKRPARIKLGKVDTPQKPSRTANTDESSPKKQATRKQLDKAFVRAPDDLAKKRLSLLDAAAQVLVQLSAKEAGPGLSAKELLERIHSAGLWSSPNGRTPHATLYAGMIREITVRKTDARFRRVGPGKFTRNVTTSPQTSSKSRKTVNNSTLSSKKAAVKGGA